MRCKICTKVNKGNPTRTCWKKFQICWNCAREILKEYSHIR